VASPHMPQMTTDLLRSYSTAALCNADELLVESSLLHQHGHNARAYFLAVACIEEAGKALLAFNAQNRNLSDPAVCTKLKADMENHAQKITCALGAWALSRPDPRKELKVALDLIIALKRGREPSMYTDLRTDPDRVQTPQGVVRATAARDCIRLAENSLNYAHRHVREETPIKFTAAHDRLFTMKSGKLKATLDTEDFWWYYIARVEVGQRDMAEAVLGYERDHVRTSTPFRPEQ
jgi:AbiV family abortive infection protein